MVRQCVVCKKVDYSNPGLIFRRFPVNPERRQRWISLLNLENQHIIKYAQICSDHFDPSDVMITQITGRKQIRPDADPQLSATVFTEPLSYSLDSTISDTSPRKSPRVSNDFESLLKSPEYPDLPEATAEQSNAGPLDFIKTEEEKMKPSSPSTETETASETEIVINRVKEPPSSSSPLSEIGDLKPQQSHQSIKKRKRYIGDLASSDFSTPEKRKRNLAFVKSWDEIRRRI